MPLVIKTAHVSCNAPDRLDVTVKSGDKTFAPSWDMVMRYKNNEIAAEEYLAAYNVMMQESWKKNKERWIEVASQDSVTLVCYCSRNSFCHRNRLAEMIAAVATKLGREVKLSGFVN